MKWVITETTAGRWIKTFLREEGRFSKRLLIKAKSEAGQLLVNGQPKTVRYTLKAGDMLEVTLPLERPPARMIPEKMKLDIVYEDSYLLVVNKPAGIAAIPSRHHPTGTVANGLLYYYETIGWKATIHVVTRLDRDTSGLMVIAKSQHCHSLLSVLQRNHKLERTYTAIVQGAMDATEGTIDQPIGRKDGSIIERTIKKDGQPAITHFAVIQQYKTAALVEVRLVTGRTHQIRVHFSSVGHALIGDELYGGRATKMARQALHCSAITFTHPFTNEQLQVKEPLSRDMIQLLETL